MKRILVTGGLGYIGSHTVVELLDQGYEVCVVDDLSNSTREVEARIKEITNKEFQFYQLDVNQTHKLGEIMSKEKIQGVIHFAAFKAVGESVEQPMKYYRNNVGGMISVMDAMQSTGVKHMVFSSSCTVYGDTDQSPITESQPVVQAISPYGTTKILCEQLLMDASRHTAIQGVILRYFNPVGAHPSAKIGELPLGVPDNLVPYITQTAAGIRKELTVFGGDYPTPDGTNIRDFIHVVDLAKAHIKAITHCQDQGKSHEVFNLGTGSGHSVLEVIKKFEEVNDVRLNYSIGDRRKGDVVQIWADSTKAEKVLGWTCQYDLSDMLKSAWNWQLQLDQS